MSESFWYLKRVTLTNILGFKELKEFTFSEGVQVIEADNHTGKTSLAIALVWGLTGQLPKIDRITANQFKLKHKLAGDKEEAAIEIILESNDGHILAILDWKVDIELPAMWVLWMLSKLSHQLQNLQQLAESVL